MMREPVSPAQQDARGSDLATLAQKFSAVYQSELPWVWKLLTRLGARSNELTDLAHDVFVAAYRQFADYDDKRPVRPWLFGIAYRILLDFKRKHQNQREESHAELEALDGRMLPDEALAQEQGLRLAAQAIDSLELDRRAVFVMHEIDGFGMPEIAEALGIPLNTAYSRLRLARRDFNLAVEAQKTRKERPRAKP